MADPVGRVCARATPNRSTRKSEEFACEVVAPGEPVADVPDDFAVSDARCVCGHEADAGAADAFAGGSDEDSGSAEGTVCGGGGGGGGRLAREDPAAD
jgi:hypothetical protein